MQNNRSVCTISVAGDRRHEAAFHARLERLVECPEHFAVTRCIGKMQAQAQMEQRIGVADEEEIVDRTAFAQPPHERADMSGQQDVGTLCSRIEFEEQPPTAGNENPFHSITCVE